MKKYVSEKMKNADPKLKKQYSDAINNYDEELVDLQDELTKRKGDTPEKKFSEV